MNQISLQELAVDISKSEKEIMISGHSIESEEFPAFGSTIIIIINADHRLNYIHTGNKIHLKYSPEKIIGQNWFEIAVSKHLRKKVIKDFHRLKNKARNSPFVISYPIIDLSGEKQNFVWKYLPLDNHTIIGLGITAAALDEFRRSETSTPDNSYRNLFHKLNDSVILHDLDGKIIDVNQKALQQFGYCRSEFLALRITDLHPHDQKSYSRDLLKKIMKDRFINFEIEFKKRNGNTFMAEVSSSLYKTNGTQLIQGIVRDITQRKQAEHALRESEEKYRSFVEEDLTGDYISTPGGQILFCNPAFLKIFGFSDLKEALQTNTSALYSHHEDREKLLSRLKTSRKLVNYEMDLLTWHGHPIHVIANIIGKFSESGDLTEIKGYLYDITEHKKMEKQFWQAQKMEAVGRLAGGVAHDFNNILSVITGYSDLLLHKLHADDPLRKDITMIQKSGDRAGSLIRQLLAFSRRQVLQPTVLNLNTLLIDLEKMLQRLIGEDIALIIKKDPKLGNIQADPSQIEQVIMNLAVNARDAMPKGGKLIIQTQNIELKEQFIQEQVVMKSGLYILLTISDTGKGMNSETQTNIFEPFFTTKEKGTGLGLSTVYGIIKQSGGYIWVNSEINAGTSFKIYLPQVKKKSIQKQKETIKSETFQGTETVLLVEDNQSVRDVAENILISWGYKVLKAESGERALQMMQEQTNKIDLMVTDVVMPGISGKTLADRISAEQKEMKVLYVSGYTDDAIIHHGMLDPHINFLQKPFRAEELLQKVREILDAAE